MLHHQLTWRQIRFSVAGSSRVDEETNMKKSNLTSFHSTVCEWILVATTTLRSKYFPYNGHNFYF